MKLASAAACDEANMPVMEGYTCCYTSYMNNTCPDSDPPDDSVYVRSTDFEAFKEERISIHRTADSLRPGLPGWGAAIFQEVYDRMRAQAEAVGPIAASADAARVGSSRPRRAALSAASI